MHSTTKLNVRSLHPIGVEVLNLNLAAGISALLFERLHDLLLRHELVLIRKQALSDTQFQQFAELFGMVERHPHAEHSAEGYPDIQIISNELRDGEAVSSDTFQFWHTDGSDLSELPMYTLLYGAVIPQDVDGRPPGDTMFLSTMAAYQDLAPELETKLAGMHAVYSGDSASSPELKSATKNEDIQHPVLRPHPVTGKTALFVNEGHVTRIAELPEEESTAILKQLFAHLANEKHVYRHKWKSGDLMVWDNNSIQHQALVDYAPEQPRYIKRITISTSSRQTSAGT